MDPDEDSSSDQDYESHGGSRKAYLRDRSEKMTNKAVKDAQMQQRALLRAAENEREEDEEDEDEDEEYEAHGGSGREFDRQKRIETEQQSKRHARAFRRSSGGKGAAQDRFADYYNPL